MKVLDLRTSFAAGLKKGCQVQLTPEYNTVISQASSHCVYRGLHKDVGRVHSLIPVTHRLMRVERSGSIVFLHPWIVCFSALSGSPRTKGRSWWLWATWTESECCLWLGSSAVVCWTGNLGIIHSVPLCYCPGLWPRGKPQTISHLRKARKEGE